MASELQSSYDRLADEYANRIYGELANAQMRLRLAIQQEVEIAASLVGMPTRSEINASHRKIADLESEVRQMK